MEFKGEKVTQRGAEAAVILHRKAQLNREVDGKRRRIRVEGELLPLRLVISELWRDDGTVVARWLLWTNLPAEIDCPDDRLMVLLEMANRELFQAVEECRPAGGGVAAGE